MKITRHDIKEKLPKFRDDNGISLLELANKTGISKKAIIAIEKGRSKNIRSKTIFSINEYLKGFPENESESEKVG